MVYNMYVSWERGESPKKGDDEMNAYKLVELCDSQGWDCEYDEDNQLIIYTGLLLRDDGILCEMVDNEDGTGFVAGDAVEEN